MITTGSEIKKILVLPSALDKNHPLYIGYVGKEDKEETTD